MVRGAVHHVEAARADLRACSASSPGSAAWACAASRRASSWARSRRRGSRCRNGAPAASTWLRCSCVSAPISCTVVERRAGELELAAGLERHGAASLALGPLQGDDVVALQDRHPAEPGDQAFHQRAHAARAVIGNGLQRVGVEQELLVLGADAPGAAPACEPAAIQATRSSRERTVRAGRAVLAGGHVGHRPRLAEEGPCAKGCAACTLVKLKTPRSRTSHARRACRSSASRRAPRSRGRERRPRPYRRAGCAGPARCA